MIQATVSVKHRIKPTAIATQAAEIAYIFPDKNTARQAEGVFIQSALQRSVSGNNVDFSRVTEGTNSKCTFIVSTPHDSVTLYVGKHPSASNNSITECLIHNCEDLYNAIQLIDELCNYIVGFVSTIRNREAFPFELNRVNNSIAASSSSSSTSYSSTTTSSTSSSSSSSLTPSLRQTSDNLASSNTSSALVMPEHTHTMWASGINNVQQRRFPSPSTVQSNINRQDKRFPSVVRVKDNKNQATVTCSSQQSPSNNTGHIVLPPIGVSRNLNPHDSTRVKQLLEHAEGDTQRRSSPRFVLNNDSSNMKASLTYQQVQHTQYTLESHRYGFSASNSVPRLYHTRNSRNNGDTGECFLPSLKQKK